MAKKAAVKAYPAKMVVKAFPVMAIKDQLQIAGGWLVRFNHLLRLWTSMRRNTVKPPVPSSKGSPGLQRRMITGREGVLCAGNPKAALAR